MHNWTLKFKIPDLENKFLIEVCTNLQKQFCLSRFLRFITIIIALIIMLLVIYII